MAVSKLNKYLIDIKGHRKLKNSELQTISIKHYPILLSEVKCITGKSCFLYIILNEISEYDVPQMKISLEILNKIMPVIYPNIGSRDNYFTKIRAVIYKKYPDIDGKCSPEKRIALSMMKLSKDDKQTKIANAMKTVKSKNRNKKQFNIDYIVKVINDTKQEKDPYKRAVSLLLVSGARPVELLFRNTYEVDKKKPQWINIRGLAKKSKN